MTIAAIALNVCDYFGEGVVDDYRVVEFVNDEEYTAEFLIPAARTVDELINKLELWLKAAKAAKENPDLVIVERI